MPRMIAEASQLVPTQCHAGAIPLLRRLHKRGQNLIDVNELQTQPFHGLREDSVHFLRLAGARRVSSEAFRMMPEIARETSSSQKLEPDRIGSIVR